MSSPLTTQERRQQEALKSLLDKLDEQWSSYWSNVKSFLSEWEKVRLELLERIAKIEGLLKAINIQLEEIQVKRELGLIDSKASAEQEAELKSRQAEVENRLNALKEFLEDIEARANVHRERVSD